MRFKFTQMGDTMKSFMIAALLIFSTSALAAPSTYDREYAFLTLLDMGYDVSVEDIGEMFRDNIFILSNSYVCSDLGAVMWDDSQSSCLMQVQTDGSIYGFQGDGNDSLYE